MPTRSHQSNHDLGVKRRFQNDSFPSCFVTKMGSQKVTELSQTRLPRQIWEGPKMEPWLLQVPLASGCKARSKWSGVEGQVCFRNRWVVWRGNGRCVAGAVGDVWLVVLQVAGGRGRWQVASGRWQVAGGRGRWHVAGGRGRWPWQVARPPARPPALPRPPATATGHLPRPRPPATATCHGHGHLLPPPASATCHGHLPRPATSCLHLPLATPATLSTLSTPATPATPPPTPPAAPPATAPHTTCHTTCHTSPTHLPLPHHTTCHTTC